MASNQTNPPFPFALDALALEGSLEALSTIELGALYRLVKAAWSQDPPCTLPDEASFLAMVARITPEEWAAAEPRLLLALHACRGNPAGRLTFQAALRVYRTAQDAATQRQARTRAATEAAAAVKRSRHASVTDPPRSRDGTVAPSVRSVFSGPALSPQRSSPSESDPSARAPEDVIAQLGERARAVRQADLSDWRRARSLDLLQKAIAAWRTSGATDCPVNKASQLADGPHSTPARVDWLIEDANARVAQAKAKGEKFNPIGWLINGLGMNQSRPRRPVDVPLLVNQKWVERESEQLRLIQAADRVRALRTVNVSQPQPQAPSVRAAAGA